MLESNMIQEPYDSSYIHTIYISYTIQVYRDYMRIPRQLAIEIVEMCISFSPISKDTVTRNDASWKTSSSSSASLACWQQLSKQVIGVRKGGNNSF